MADEEPYADLPPSNYLERKAEVDAIFQTMHLDHMQWHFGSAALPNQIGKHWYVGIETSHFTMQVMHRDFDLLIEKVKRMLLAFNEVPECLGDQLIIAHD